MIEFISIATHAAVAYLHGLLALKFYSSRRESLAVHLFWYLMVLFAVLHGLYGLRIFAELYGWMSLGVATSISATCLLLFSPPLLLPTLFGELTALPESEPRPARWLREIPRHMHAAILMAFTISLTLSAWVLLRYDSYVVDDNMLSLHYAACTFGLWALMIAAGLRYDESKSNDLAKPTGILFAVLMVFYGITVYMVDLGEFWSLIPVVSTVSFSLLLAWIRFRLQFIDVILRQCVVFLLVMVALSLGYLLVLELGEQPEGALLLVLFGYCAVSALVIKTVVTGFNRIWMPSPEALEAIHQTLPRRLSACTTKADAIHETQHFLMDTFNAGIAINQPHEQGAQYLSLPGRPALNLQLGYIRGWMPWFSDAIHWVRTAGLYLQGHLQVLTALEQMHAQALESQTLSELATRAELSAMRARIRPHFLFNTLNSIHSFVRDDPVAAERTIELLAELMRGAAQGTDADLCPLSTEMALSRAYLEIEKMRFGDRLHFAIHCDPSCADVPVPTFSIQPLIENAVKYSVDGQREAGEVEVEVVSDGDCVVISVRDNGVGFADESQKGLGMALDNVRERLRSLYGGSAVLVLGERIGGGMEASLRIPVASS